MKHFTLEEASRALAEVRPLAERLVDAHRELARAARALESVRRAVAGNGGGLEPARVEALERAATRASESVRDALERIHALGAQVKDPERGLVDFPAVHPDDGRTVLLCWHVGEDEIGYWHGPEDGFAGRKPLPF